MPCIEAWNKRNDLVDSVLELYNRPMSVKAIAKELGVSRVPVQRILKEHGIKPRSRSEAMFLRMNQTSPDQRKELTRKANKACRGTPKSLDHRMTIARSKSRLIGPGEQEICDWLTQAGVSFQHQAPVYVYNVDFLLCDSVAMELRTGRSHGFNTPKFRKKVEKLLEGHTVVLIWAKTVEALVANKDQLVPDLQLLSSDKTTSGQEWVIRCNEHRFTRFRNDFGQFSCEPMPPEFSYTRYKV